MKLLVLDIDGTLVNSQKEITPITLAALTRWREAGNRIALATGRPTAGVKKVAAMARMQEEGGYILSYNGGCIHDAASGKRLSGKVLPADIPPKLAEFALARPDMGLISYQGDTVLSLKEPDDYIRLEALTINHMNLQSCPDFADYIDFPVHKCLFTAPPQVAEGYEQELRTLFGDRVSIYRSEPFFIEAMPFRVDKAVSLEEFVPTIGLSREDVICIGDGYNDLSMIRWAGLGVAMANAHPPVKEAADHITLSCDNDGVAAVIDLLLSSSLE